MDAQGRMFELARQGFFCSQILLTLALDSEGKSDPDLVRAMGGLNGGIGNTGGVCGSLTGGACFISYFAGKGSADETAHPDCDKMIAELADWFSEYTAEYGGNLCRTILAGDERNKIQRCPMLITSVLKKCMDLLESHGVI